MGYRTESALWTRLVRVLGDGIATRIEVRIPDGLPDVIVNLGDGRAAWVELKIGLQDPVSPLRWRAPRLTLEQAIFLGGWRRAGGLGGVLVAHGDQVAYVTDNLRGLRKEGAEAAWTGRLDDRATILRVLGR